MVLGLTHYHTIPTFNNPEKEGFCLVTSIFSFSHNVFTLPKTNLNFSATFFFFVSKNFQFGNLLCGKGLNVAQMIKYSHITHLIFGSIFSSPEHKVFRVSYCDSAESVVCHASSVVHRPWSTFWLVCALEATIIVRLSWNMVRMFVWMTSHTNFESGSCWVQT